MQAGGAPVTGDEGYTDPRWSWPEYPDDAVVELRIHGVGGEGPEGMTRDPHPVRVGGDDGVGFWRARNPVVPGGSDAGVREVVSDAHVREVVSDAHVREVVSWGGSTSGRSRSAFWVLLLPFALFNAAGRMAPAGASPRRLAWHQAVCRLLALSMTLAVVAMTSGVVFDLLALQCGAVADCAEADVVGRWLLAPLRWFPEDAAALVAVLGLVPALVPYLLRLLGRRELTGATGRPSSDTALGSRGPQLLDEPDFWRNLWPAWRLRGLHITAGYAWSVMVLGLLLPPLLPDAPDWFGMAVWIGVGSILANAALVAAPRVAGTAPSRRFGAVVLALRWVTLVVLGLLVGTGLAGATPSPTVVRGVLFAGGLVGAVWGTAQHLRHVRRSTTSTAGPSGAVRDAVTATAVVALAAVVDPAGPARVATAAALDVLPEAGPLMGALLAGAPAPVYAPLWWLVLAQVVLLVVLVVTSAGRPGSTRSTRGPLGTAAVPANLAAPVVALLSLLLVTAVGGGLHAFVLDWLGRRVAEVGATPFLADTAGATADIATVAPREAVGLALPWWQPLVAQTVVSTAAVLAVAAWVLHRWADRYAPPAPVVRRTVARSLAGLPEPSVAGTDDRLAQTGRLWLHQALIRRAGTTLAAAVSAVLVAVLAIAVTWAATGSGPVELPGATPALAVVALIPPAAVALIRAAREDRLLRRQLGALWDVLAFWPRVTHPFSPPSYGEALVPAVAARLDALPEDAPVLLTGHSQGSVVALATALHPGGVPRPLHLVTYGSPLTILYEGFFPTVFGGDHGAIARGTPGPHSPVATWHNVLTVSEPLGSPLWRWSVTDPPGRDADTPGAPDGAGWPVLLRLPWAACPVCGWRRPVHPAPGAGPGATDPPEVTDPPVPAVDLTITDPDRLVSPAGEVDGHPAGHSSYHRSRELDLHLAHLATVARRTGGTDGTDGTDGTPGHAAAQ